MEEPANEEPRRISVIGLGNMGSALAKAFIMPENQVTVWNRTASKAQPLAKLGAHVAGSPSDAVAASDVIVVCLPSYAVSDTLFHATEVSGLMGGRTLIQLSTGTPQEAIDGAEWASQHRVNYLDGAIMDVPERVGTSDLIHFYSGRKEIFESHKPWIDHLGVNSYFAGENPGSASALDCGILSFGFGSWLSFIHGAALCESVGIPPEQFSSATFESLNRLVLPTLHSVSEMIGRRDYPGSIAKIKQYVTASDTLVRSSEESGVDSRLPATIADIFRTALNANYGENDLAAVFEVLRTQATSE